MHSFPLSLGTPPKAVWSHKDSIQSAHCAGMLQVKEMGLSFCTLKADLCTYRVAKSTIIVLWGCDIHLLVGCACGRSGGDIAGMCWHVEGSRLNVAPCSRDIAMWCDIHAKKARLHVVGDMPWPCSTHMCWNLSCCRLTVQDKIMNDVSCQVETELTWQNISCHRTNLKSGREFQVYCASSVTPCQHVNTSSLACL